jgi:hypothetical protein
MGKAPTPSVRSGKGASRHKSKTEAGDKPFACNHCAARFAHMSGLSRHDRVSHRNGALVQLRRPELTDAVKAQLRRGQWQRAQEARRKPQVREAGPCLLFILYDQVAQGTCSRTVLVVYLAHRVCHHWSISSMMRWQCRGVNASAAVPQESGSPWRRS